MQYEISLNTDNKSFENMTSFEYLVMITKIKMTFTKKVIEDLMQEMVLRSESSVFPSAIWQRASIIRAIALMMEAVRTSESRSISTRLYGIISQTVIIFILSAVRTWNRNVNIKIGQYTILNLPGVFNKILSGHQPFKAVKRNHWEPSPSPSLCTWRDWLPRTFVSRRESFKSYRLQ
jgi:hypothetical protein